MEKQEMCMERWERSWTWEGVPVLTCRCTLPRFPDSNAAGRRMERFWRRREKLLLEWLGEYHRRCCVRSAQALAASRPILCDRVQAQVRVEAQRGDLLSLELRLEVNGRVRCWPELWNRRQGVMVSCRPMLTPLERLRWGGGRLLLTSAGVAVLSRAGERRLIHPFAGESGENPCATPGKRV